MGDRLKAVWQKGVKEEAATWTVVFTGLLTITTIILATIGWQANQTSVTSQRAFVNFQSIQATERFVDDKGKITAVQFVIAWNNSGTTPAERVHARVNILPVGPSIQDSFNFPDQGNAPTFTFVVGPKGTQTVGPAFVQMHTIQEVQTGNIHLYFYGWVTYNDVFTKERHLTEFCQEFVNPRQVTNGNASGNDLSDPAANVMNDFITCHPEHSCYDKDCSDYRERIGQ